MIILVLLSPIIEHLTERIKNFLADLLDNPKTSPYWAVWSAPFIAYGFSLLILWLLGIEEIFKNAIIPTGGSIIWYEVSSLWKKDKRDSLPLRTKGLAKVIKETKLEL